MKERLVSLGESESYATYAAENIVRKESGETLDEYRESSLKNKSAQIAYSEFKSVGENAPQWVKDVDTDKYKGTKREDRNLKYDYVLLSAFSDENYIVPVELHIKEYNTQKVANKLYVSITLGKIKIEDNVKVQTSEKTQRNNTRLSSIISLPRLLSKINSEYGNFYKYIPKLLLNESQQKSKQVAEEDEDYRLKVMRGEDVIIKTGSPIMTASQKSGKTVSEPIFNDSLTQEETTVNSDVKQKQLEIIEKVNPAPNTYNTWIRKVEDIKTLAETLEDSDWADGDEFNPDLTREMIEEAIESGEITVYSSYPIGQGVFVSPSYMEAASYSGDGNVYEKTVSIDDVAWIDPTQGMYASTTEKAENGTQKQDFRNSLKIKYTNGSIEEIISARDLTNEKAIDYLEKAKKGELMGSSYVPVRKDTPRVIIDSLAAINQTIENYPLVMQVRKAQQSMRNEYKTNNKKYGSNVRKHGLKPEEIIEIIDNLDNPNLIVYQTERKGKDGKPLPDNVAVFVNYIFDEAEGLAVLEFDSLIDPEFIDKNIGDTAYHTVVTVFKPDTVRDGIPFDYADELLSNPNNFELEIKERQSSKSVTREKHPNTLSELSSNTNLSQNNNGVNTNSTQSMAENLRCK